MAPYDPTDEFQDDRDRQDQLVDDTPRADRDSRIDEGGSDKFQDDRATRESDVEPPDAGSQASLVEDDVEDGQLDLDGETATEDPEWQADDDGDVSLAVHDPETGTTDSVTVPDGVNGWERQDNPRETRGAAVWTNPSADAPADYLHVVQTGAESYLVQRQTGERGDYDTENVATVRDITDAISRATDYMAVHGVDPDTATDGGVYDPTDEFGGASDADDVEGVESVEEQTVAEALDLDVDAEGWSSPSMDEEGTVSWRYERGEMDGGDVVVAAGPQDRGPYWEVRVGFVSLLEAVRVAVREGEDEAVEWARGWIENQGDPPPMDPDDVVQVYEKDQVGSGPGAPLANAEKAAKLGVDPVEEDPRDPYEGRDVLRSDEPETVSHVDLDNRVEATSDVHGVLTSDDGSSFDPDYWRIVDEADDDGEDEGYRNEQMENAHYWAAQLLGWMKRGPNAGLRGSYYVDIVAGQPVLVMDKSWSRPKVRAIWDGLRDAGFPQPMEQKQLADTHYRIFIEEPTDDRLASSWYPGDWREYEPYGGDGGDPEELYAADQLEWDTPNPATDDGGGVYDPTDDVADVEEADDSEQQADADSETDQADPQVGEPDEADSDDFDGALEPLAYTVEGSSETWGHATDALGLLRRNWSDARHDAEGYDRDDVSELVATINDRAGEDVDVTETEMDVLWHASSQLAEEDQRAANQLDRVLNAAMNDAERPAVDLPESLAEAVERSTDADGWEPHEWTRPSDSLYFAEYNRRGSSETVAIEPVGDGYSVTFVDVDDDETATFDGSTQDPLAAVIEGLNDYYGDTDDVGRDVPEVPAGERAGETIEFGSRDSANEYRDGHPDALHPADDDRRYKTVTLHPDATRDVVDVAETEAQKSKADDTKSYGQTALTDDERDQLENRDTWSWSTNGFEAMSAKAALEAEGATDWMNYYEPGEGVGGALKLLEAGKEAEAAGRGPTGIKGDYVDSEKSDAEIGRAVEKAEGKAEEHAREACEDGEPLACDELLREYGWSEAEVERIKAAAETVEEEAAEIYDPSVDEADDSGMAYEEWAAEQAPEPPAEPSDDELAEIAPLPEAEMTGQAYRALKKAWTGYKLARRDAHQAHAEADEYARVINGIRAVNDQEPLDMDSLEWSGGPVLPDDPTEEYPAPDHPGGEPQESIEEAAEHGHAAGPIQRTIGDAYDPTEEF
jgi:hypothetical protein